MIQTTPIKPSGIKPRPAGKNRARRIPVTKKGRYLKNGKSANLMSEKIKP
jgi:hypothetical protein